MNQLLKFPSIEQFRNVKRNVEWRAQFQGLDENNEPVMDRLAKMPTLKFTGTPKLHGCNAGLIINPDKSFYCQSRERIITPENDNYGFARFIHELPISFIEDLYNCFNEFEIENKPIAIYGEWAGKGIQVGVGINNLEKSWFIFAARIINEENLDEENWIDLSNFSINLNNRVWSIYDFPSYEIEIDFERAELSVEKLNELTLEVEKKCPVAAQLGFDGIGEGIVWKCVHPDFHGSKYFFKVKGDAHSSSNVKKLANVDIEKLNNILEFIDRAANEERLNQAWEYIKEMNLPLTEKSTGDFIKWMFNDILKEEKDLMNQNGFKEKEIGGPIAKKSKRWFFEKLAKSS